MDFEKNKLGNYGGVYFRRTQAYMKAAFKNIGLSFIDGIIVIIVCDFPGIIQDQIGTSLSLDKATVTRSLKQLERKEIIERIVDENNQRMKKVYPTSLAYKYDKMIDDFLTHWNDSILQDFTKEEYDTLMSLLIRLKNASIAQDLNAILNSLDIPSID